jgi:O-antigen ligase
MIQIFLNKIQLPLFYLILLIFRLPPFYVLPIKRYFLISHSFASVVLLFLFVFIIFKKIKGRSKQNTDILHFLIIFYLFAQTLSIINVISLKEFLGVYKDITLGIILFFVANQFLNTKTKIIKAIQIIIFGTVVNIFIQTIIYFDFPIQFLYLKSFFYDKYIFFTELQVSRFRFFIDSYDGALIPFILFFIIKEKKLFRKFFLILIILLVLFFSVISNFRVLLIVSILSLSTTIFSIVNIRKKTILLITILVFTTLSIANITSIELTGRSTINRLLLEDKEDIQTIKSRFNFWHQSVKMGLSQPLFGIGLGNFYNYLYKGTSYFSTNEYEKNLLKITSSHPHNIFFASFAETGFLGLFSLLLLLCYFIYFDFQVIKKHNNLINITVISFWSLFFYSLVGPKIVVQYLSLFWLLRSILYLQSKKDHY